MAALDIIGKSRCRGCADPFLELVEDRDPGLNCLDRSAAAPGDRAVDIAEVDRLNDLLVARMLSDNDLAPRDPGEAITHGAEPLHRHGDPALTDPALREHEHSRP